MEGVAGDADWDQWHRNGWTGLRRFWGETCSSRSHAAIAARFVAGATEIWSTMRTQYAKPAPAALAAAQHRPAIQAVVH